jgi:hypothetical protein
MTDNPDYDPCADWIPPKPIRGDDILVDDAGPGGLGRNVPFWKVLLWHTARARTEQARADSAVAHTPLHDEEKPPPLVADAVERAPPEPAIPPEVLSAIEAKIDELNERLDRFERMREAEQALLDLEERMKQEMSPSDDDDDLLLN